MRPYDPSYSANLQQYPVHWISNAVRSGLIERPGRDGTEVISLGSRRRSALIPETINRYVGFRCARSLEPGELDADRSHAPGSTR